MDKRPMILEFPDGTRKDIEGNFINGELETDEKIEEKTYKLFFLDNNYNLIVANINKR